MVATLIAIFAIGYLFITLEHPLRLDKTVPALIMAAMLWAAVAIGFEAGLLEVVNHKNQIFGSTDEGHALKEILLHHLANTAEIVIFLLGAMTIVELIDLHLGFSSVNRWVTTKSRTRLLWIIGVLAFVLSAIIDNLTATIVLVSLLKTLVSENERRIWYVGMVVIAANAGGAWSPIGDVTTTMLWISEKVTAVGLVSYLILPAIVCFIVPFSIASVFLKAFQGQSDFRTNEDHEQLRLLSSNKILYLGLGAIAFVPVFKIATGLPPYMGMLLGLGFVWMVSEYINPEENMTRAHRKLYSAKRALSRVELSSVLFFLGILLSVAAIETTVYGAFNGQKVGILRYAAEVMQESIPSRELTIVLLGMSSSVVDNVPLVAAAIGMFDHATDDSLWHLLAFCAGTGGSMLIIGSAAGVAAMGMEKIKFGWYLRNIGWLALIGFLSGAGAFLLFRPFVSCC